MPRRQERGLTLVEVAVTLIVAGVVLLPLSIFIVTMTQASQTASERMSLSMSVLTATNNLHADVMNSHKAIVVNDRTSSPWITLSGDGMYGEPGSQIHYEMPDGHIYVLRRTSEGQLVVEDWGDDGSATQPLSTRTLAFHVEHFEVLRDPDRPVIEATVQMRDHDESDGLATVETSLALINEGN